MAFGRHLVANENATAPPRVFGRPSAQAQSAENEEELVRVTIKAVRFVGDNGFFIAQVSAKDKPELKTFSLKASYEGIGSESVGLKFDVWVKSWDDNPKYNSQTLVAKAIHPSEPETIDEFVVLIGERAEGLGKKALEKIQASFGDKALDILRDYPEQMVPVIGAEKTENLLREWQAQRSMHEVRTVLLRHGFEVQEVQEICVFYKNTYLRQNLMAKSYQEDMEANPYILTSVPGIKFAKVDRMALALGITRNDVRRARAGLQHTIKTYMSQTGNTFVKEEDLKRGLQKLVSGIDVSKLPVEAWVGLHQEKMQVNGASFVAFSTSAIADAEKVILKMCLRNSLDRPDGMQRREAPKVIKVTDSLNEEQLSAVENSLRLPVSMLTGGPGTGKTRTIKSIIDSAKELKWEIGVMAPTGKASQRIRELTGFENASTIHMGLGAKGPNDYEYGAHNLLTFDMVLVDESSMVDTELMGALCAALPDSCRLVLVGDPNQLSPVGPGQPFRDLLRSNRVPKVTLKKIYRQAEGSDIAVAAAGLMEGRLDLALEPDWQAEAFCFPTSSDEETVMRIEEILSVWEKQGISKDDMQIFSAYRHKGMLSSKGISEHVKGWFNPVWMEPDAFLEENKVPYRLGDRLMYTGENNKEKGVFKGDIGKVVELASDALMIDFGNKRLKEFARSEWLKSFEAATAYTVHKSQGSEMPYVIMPLTKTQGNMLDVPLLYTGLTRAKKQFIWVGDIGVLKDAVANRQRIERESCLYQGLLATPELDQPAKASHGKSATRTKHP